MNEINLISIMFAAILSFPVSTNADCFDLIQQYYHCKNLKMIQNQIGPIRNWYPDPKQPITMLPESFYAAQGLSTMSFEQSMSLIQKIHKESNCNSNFCKCVSIGHIDRPGEGQYSLFFRNDVKFAQTKSIISHFNLNMAQYRLSFDQLKNHWNSNLPTLTRFCLQNEFTYKRFSFFSAQSRTCLTKKDNSVRLFIFK